MERTVYIITIKKKFKEGIKISLLPTAIVNIKIILKVP